MGSWALVAKVFGPAGAIWALGRICSELGRDALELFGRPVYSLTSNLELVRTRGI